jgi:hypothetical protein
MEAAEIQAKATIAAALIACHAVEIPAIPKRSGLGSIDSDATRLRDLTDYVYQALAAVSAGGSVCHGIPKYLGMERNQSVGYRTEAAQTVKGGA